MPDSPPPTRSLFGKKRQRRRDGVRMVVTGQVGLEKKAFLQRVVEIAKDNGRHVSLINIGERMYEEAPDIAPGRILDLPRQRLTALRRSVFKDVLAEAASGKNLIVNTHATFRWKHGLFHAYDHAQMEALDADLYVTVVDNVDALHERLEREHSVAHTLKDILVWREEEMVVTEAMAEAIAGHGQAFVVSRGASDITARSLQRLMFEPDRKKVYPSYPMTHVLDQPAVLAEIEAFRDRLAEDFTTFDPSDVDEKRLLIEADRAAGRGDKTVDIAVNGRTVTLDVDEIQRVAGDIDGQIYARDFKLIDQADMIVSYIPQLPDGKPAISSGVERELQHAFEATKEVYVVWKPAHDPSPFVSETATGVFSSVDALLAEFRRLGYLGDYQLSLGGGSGPRDGGAGA
jgi:adenylate kinase